MATPKQFPVVEVGPAGPTAGPTFQLGPEIFRCLPALPSGLFDLLPLGNYSAQQAIRFIRGALVPEDESRFMEAARSKRRVVEVITLTHIVDWLLDPSESGGAGLFPFAAAPPTPSPPGPAAPAPGSVAASPSPASTPTD